MLLPKKRWIFTNEEVVVVVMARYLDQALRAMLDAGYTNYSLKEVQDV